MSAAKKLIEKLKEEVDSSKASDFYLQLVEIFPLQKLTSKSLHESALKIMEKLIDYTNSSAKKDEGITAYIQTLSSLIEEYERERFQSVDVPGSEMLEYLMDLRNLKQTDLSKELGGQSVVISILAVKLELNIKQIRALARKLKVSPSVFI